MLSSVCVCVQRSCQVQGFFSSRLLSLSLYVSMCVPVCEWDYMEHNGVWFIIMSEASLLRCSFSWHLNTDNTPFNQSPSRHTVTYCHKGHRQELVSLETWLWWCVCFHLFFFLLAHNWAKTGGKGLLALFLVKLALNAILLIGVNLYWFKRVTLIIFHT